jgi:hypothetical protein
MTRYSTSRGILYSAPPAAPATDEKEEATAEGADASGTEPAAADD